MSFKIFYKDRPISDQKILGIHLEGKQLKADLLQVKHQIDDPDCDSFDTVELESYRSYALVFGKTRIRKGLARSFSICKWVDLTKLCSAYKDDYGEVLTMHRLQFIAQIETGVITDTVKEIMMWANNNAPANIELSSDIGYEFVEDPTIRGHYMRDLTWDNYYLTVNGKEFAADRFNKMIKGDNSIPLVCEEGKDYIEFKVQKYKPMFGDDKLERDIDNEEIFIETSAGLCNPRRIQLVKGKGSFRIYPFGYQGKLKVKIGRKWYSAWNDFEFILG